MAKIVNNNHHLENEYQKSKSNDTPFAAGIFVFLILTVICIFVYVKTESVAFIIAAVLLFIAGLISTYSRSSSGVAEQQILLSGIIGESSVASTLSKLPDSYTVFQDVVVNYDGSVSEIDNIVVGKTGVFVIETKNHNGTIIGSYEEKDWQQNKVGRGGTPYTANFYSPVKQVGTHIFRLKNMLKKNDIRVYINGAVYFSNPEAYVFVKGKGDTPVFCVAKNGEEQLLEYILSGDASLSNTMIKKINTLLDK